MTIGEVQDLLATERGVDALEAIVAHRLLRGDMTREDTQAQLGLARIVAGRRRVLADAVQDERDADLSAQLAELKTLIGGNKGNALRADLAVTPPLEGDDQLREDMAPAPASPRSREPYQS